MTAVKGRSEMCRKDKSSIEKRKYWDNIERLAKAAEKLPEWKYQSAFGYGEQMLSAESETKPMGAGAPPAHQVKV